MKGKRSLVIIRIWEGLGNQMFQYAYARSLKAKGIDVYLDLNKSFEEILKKNKSDTIRINSIQNFNISIPSIDLYKYGKYNYLIRNTILDKIIFWCASHFLWKYKILLEEEPIFYPQKRNLIGNWYIKGWFQDERYFKEIRTTLIKEFTPLKKIKSSKNLRSAIESAESVSLHIRRGDYVKLNYSLNLAYYKKAINYIKNLYRKPVFLIFSDDLEWVKQNFVIEEEAIYINENKELQDYEELLIMSKCKSNIISNSTFSWWGAWLNQNPNKIVIAPNKWLKLQKNIIPKEWVIM